VGWPNARITSGSWMPRSIAGRSRSSGGLRLTTPSRSGGSGTGSVVSDPSRDHLLARPELALLDPQRLLSPRHIEAHTFAVAARRDEENAMYACMALPPNAHRVHAPEDDPTSSARGARQTGRNSWRRVFRRRRRRIESLK
jgi:hypothetical protein